MNRPGVEQQFFHVKGHIERVRNRIKSESTGARPYPMSNRNFGKAKQGLLQWLSMCDRIRKAYYSEVSAPQSSMVEYIITPPYIIRWLSRYVNEIENWFNGILHPRIAIEAELLVAEILGRFDLSREPFVLMPSGGFQRDRLSHLIQRSSPPKIPGKDGFNFDIKKEVDHLGDKDFHIIKFEVGQFDNVMTWPNLLHEALHIVYEAKDWEREVKGLRVKAKWIPEVFIDIICTRLFEAAYPLSLAIHCLRFPHGKSESHPSMAPRMFGLVSLLDYLKTEKNLDTEATRFAGKYVWEAKEAMGESEMKKLDLMHQIVKEINEKIIPRIMPEEPDTRSVESFPSGEKYREIERSDPEQIRSFHRLNLPIAAEPKALFNAFVSKEFVQNPPSADFIALSLKKWYTVRAWNSLERKPKTIPDYSS